jgi:putative addiction module component (TIGR02574 family)
MSTTFSEVERQAKTLPPNDRARLAEVLLESLQDDSLREIESAWKKEIEARITAYDRGEIKTFSAEEVFTEAKQLSR